jgi:hypothetical protein
MISDAVRGEFSLGLLLGGDAVYLPDAPLQVRDASVRSSGSA